MTSNFTSALRKGILAAVLVIAAITVKAQVNKTEGFENSVATGFPGTVFPNIELPFGWSSGFIAPSNDANNYWDRVNNAGAVFPTAGTRLGSQGAMRFRSYYQVNAVNNPEAGYLCSRQYDLSARGAITSTVSFWVFRDNVYNYADNITVYVNNSPVMAGATQIPETGVGIGLGNLPRNSVAIPPAAMGNNSWNQYTYTIPAAGFSTNTVYVLIKVTHNGVGAGGGNVYIDDFSIQTYPGAQSYSSIALTQQNLAAVAKPSSNNWIIQTNVLAINEGTQCALTAGGFTFTHNGSSNPGTDVALSGTGGVKLWWTGGTATFSLTNAIQVGAYAGANFPVANFSIIPTAAAVAAMGGGLLNGNNYFWLTYDIAAGAIANDLVDADFISANLGACGIPVCGGGLGCSVTGGRPIDVAYCVPSYAAGTSWLNGSYTNNDYVKHVICAGDPAYPPGIDNDHNDVGPNVIGSGSTGSPNDPCVPAGGCTGGNCPFSVHGPDYQKFGTASVVSMGCVPVPVGGNSSRTAVFLRTNVAPPTYNINIQCGTWYGSNYVAAFIDFDHDGNFNPAMWNAGGEKIFQSTAMVNLSWQNGNFQIPWVASPYYGQTTMRVREWYAQPNIDACSPGYYGEVEDYTVTLRPDCSPLYPGWKIWLGYTDDWNVNSNWCGGVPTINDNALIPGKGAAAYNRGANTYHPVIKSGVFATTRKLEIVNDTVEVNAPVPGSLRVSDSLSIGNASSVNTAALMVDSNYINKAVMLNGVTTDIVYVPFRGVRDMKMQILYKVSEFQGQGMIDGDVIDAIEIPIRSRKSTAQYQNFNVNMWYGANSASNYPQLLTIGFTGAPNVTAPSAAQVAGTFKNVFSGNVDMSTIPLNAAGSKMLTLQNPFTVNSVVGSVIVVEICFSNPASFPDDQMWQTNTAGYRSVMIINNNVAAGPQAGCAISNTTGFAQKLTNNIRPNLHFWYHRTYVKFPISMEYNAAAPAPTTAQWGNFGTFVPANSIVEFKSTAAVEQHIDGSNITTFDELKVNTATANVRLMKANTIVNDTLWLTAGRLFLNKDNVTAGLLTLNNNSLGAITRTGGYFQSENLAPNYGQVNWKMGNVTGNHVFPFITATTNGSVYIPFTYNALGGTADLTVGTYYPSTTPPSLLPWPTGVTTINSYNNPAVTDAPNLVRRFWTLTNTGAAPNADLTFMWAGNANETPTNGVPPGVQSQRWQGGTMTWDFPTGGQTNAPATTVLVPNVTTFNTPWVLSRIPEPLPVTLLSFKATPEKNRVKLDWVTESEKNCDKFIVERTADANHFTFIDEVRSQATNSNSTLNYFTYDNNPQVGKHFYRLTQKDLNGGDNYSKLVPVIYGSEAGAFEITKTVTKDDGSFDVEFNYNSDLPCTYKIVDMLGNVVVAQKDFKAQNGHNKINIDTHLATGVYSIMIQNQEETVTRKIFK